MPKRWGDSEAAAALGIQTYVSTPIRATSGELIGTLCAASKTAQPLTEDTKSVLRLFSSLIANWLERDRLATDLRVATSRLSDHALTDGLTGLPNRRATLSSLERQIAQAHRQAGTVLVAMIDLDHFNAINVEHGRDIGDQFLNEAARRMQASLRATDVLGRYGGEEFAIVAPGPASGDTDEAAAAAVAQLQERVTAVTAGTYAVGNVLFEYAGASVGVIAVDPNVREKHLDAEAAMQLAGEQMYVVKQHRRIKS